MAYPEPIQAGELASRLGGKLEAADPHISLDGIGSLADAIPSQVAFYANPVYRKQLASTRAGVVLIAPSEWQLLDRDSRPPALLLDDPYGGFCKVLAWLTPEPPLPVPSGTVHPTAVMAPSARLGNNVTIAPGCVIADDVTIGDDTVLEARVVVEAGTQLGQQCHLHAGVIVRYGSQLGDRVVLQPGVVIGGDGFGFAPTSQGLQKIPQRGRVRIGNDVEIGANSTVDRATFGETVIADGCKIDNLVMIGHNVEVGSYSILVAQTGISGSTHIGNGVQIGGQAGLAGHIRIGDFARIGAQSGVDRDVPSGATVIGSLALPDREWLRIQALMKKLPEIWQKVRKL